MNLETLKNLAKSEQFQSLYRRMKEGSSIRLFHNQSDLTKIQEYFLNYIDMYALLYRDLREKKPYISEDVIEDNLRAEAYLLWRSIQSPSKSQKKETTSSSDTPSIIFKRSNK